MNTPITNQPAAAQQSTPTTPNDAGGESQPSYEDRVASVFGDATDTSAAESTTPTGQTTPANVDVAAERRARLAALTAKERESVAAQTRHRESEDIRRRLADAERRAKEAEERASRGVDPSKLDEEGWLSLGERLEIPPDKIAGWIRERMTNPEAVARRVAAGAAASALDPKLAPVTEEVKALRAKLDAFEAAQQKQTEEAEERAALGEFVQFTQANMTTAPLSANVLANAGIDEFYKLARSAAARVPEGAGPQAILDQIEEDLYGVVTATAPKSAASTQQRQAPTPNPAAAKAHTTVSNTLAQGRASVVNDETDWASLSFEERSARLFR